MKPLLSPIRTEARCKLAFINQPRLDALLGDPGSEDKQVFRKIFNFDFITRKLYNKS
jgi:hypothetical protein